jgi:hypothetical protein
MHRFERMLARYEVLVKRVLLRPVRVLAIFGIVFVISLSLYAFLASPTFRRPMPANSSSTSRLPPEPG